jgi:hypothetical protein
MTPNVAKRLLDALEAARRIQEFIGSKSADHYAQDPPASLSRRTTIRDHR